MIKGLVAAIGLVAASSFPAGYVLDDTPWPVVLHRGDRVLLTVGGRDNAGWAEGVVVDLRGGRAWVKWAPDHKYDSEGRAVRPRLESLDPAGLRDRRVVVVDCARRP